VYDLLLVFSIGRKLARLRGENHNFLTEYEGFDYGERELFCVTDVGPGGSLFCEWLRGIGFGVRLRSNLLTRVIGNIRHKCVI